MVGKRSVMGSNRYRTDAKNTNSYRRQFRIGSRGIPSSKTKVIL